MPFVTIPAALIITGMICSITGHRIAGNSKKKSAHSAFAAAAAICFFTAFALPAVISSDLAGYPSVWKTDIKTVFTDFINNPVQEKGEPRKGKIFFWFRYECSDCRAARDRLESYMEEHGRKPTWYCTRAKKWEDMREKYPVESVPCAVLIKPDGSFVSKPLYDPETDTVLTENLDRLFALQEAWFPEQWPSADADRDCTY